jgi:hypothetical protein
MPGFTKSGATLLPTGLAQFRLIWIIAACARWF